MRLGTALDWQAACVAAAVTLSEGLDGEHVQRGEPWEYAIGRVAAEIFAAEGYGRPRGAVPLEWLEVTRYVASHPSVAEDGLVAGPGGLRLPLSMLPSVDASKRARS